jgi:2-dehydro-3-deoxyphosphogluconate aldolase / (4S)-4-hydroxy-2-oxoglutarate aldolase
MDGTMTTVQTRESVVRAIEELGIVAVIRIRDPRRLRSVIDAIAAGGVKVMEVTMTVPDAVAMIAEIAPTLPLDFLFGAGTVLDADTARAVIDAGARFVVAPVFRPEVMDVCHERGVPVCPGCFSPTEILEAHDRGADLVKVFPATALGPQFIKDIRAPMPQLKLMPTGGVTLDNAGDWIRAGAVAVGVGSALLDAAAIDEGRFGVITANAKRIVASVTSVRKKA